MTRPTNPELVAQFRALLTGGVYFTNANGDRFFASAEVEKLAETKPWRAELWSLFNEIEERLCPLEVETRRRLKAGNEQ